MRLIVKGVHLRVTQTLRRFVATHLVAPIERFCDDPAASVEVHLVDTNGPKGGLNDKECRVTVLMPGSRGLHLTEATDDIYKSVALAKDRLERLSKKEVERRRSFDHHGLRGSHAYTPDPGGLTSAR